MHSLHEALGLIPSPTKTETGVMVLYNTLLGRLMQEDGKFKGQPGL